MVQEEKMLSNKKLYLFSVITILLVLISGCGNNATREKEENSADISFLIKERVANQYNVGIVVAVMDSTGMKFYSCGKTSKQVDSSLVNENTLFPIASVTKVFTTLLLANDVVNGLVKLDDPANKFLPQNLRLPKYGKLEITLEDLATHTSGLPTFGCVSEGQLQGYSMENFQKFLSQAKLIYPPGTHYEYSNMIGLIGIIEANLWNMPYEKLLKEKILQPLAMYDTKVIPFPSKENVDVIGYDGADLPGLPWALPILEGSAALYSNANDLAKFVSANIGIIKTPLYPAMQLTHQPVHSEGPPLIDFDFPGRETLEIGLGWNIDAEHNVIWKNGNFPNYTSFVGFNMKEHRGVAVLANTGNIAYTDNLALHILNSEIELLPIYREIDLSKETIDKYAGKFKISDDEFYLFISEGNHLKTQHIVKEIPSDFFNIYPLSQNQFFTRIVNATFTFSAQENGEMSFLLKEGNETYIGVRIKDSTFIQ